MMPEPGTKTITELNIYNLAFHARREETVEKVTKRREISESLAGLHFKRYLGKAIIRDRKSNEGSITILGRIVVEIDTFHRLSPYPTRYLNGWKDCYDAHSSMSHIAV